MKLTTLAIATAGYVLGAKAGRERYDQIVRIARRIGGSQTVQSTAGMVQGQLDQLATHARSAFAAKIAGGQPRPKAHVSTNGFHHRADEG